MELIIDNNFKQAYTLYYEQTRAESVLEAVNSVFLHSDPEVLIDTVNTVKTCMVLGYTYTKCYEETISKISNKFPEEEDIDKFILSVVLKIMIAAGSNNINEIIKQPRDIFKEAASRYFRIPYKRITEEMKNSMIESYKTFDWKGYDYANITPGDWDKYFYSVCRQVSQNSKCFSRKIGTVLVKDKSIISTGYNGPPRGIPRCDLRWEIDGSLNDYNVDDVINKCPRRVLGYKSGEGLDMCTATHAEVNAVVNAARLGIPTIGSTMYMTCEIPCHNCLQVLINAGVKEIVVTSLNTYDNTSMYLLNQSDISVRIFNFIK